MTLKPLLAALGAAFLLSACTSLEGGGSSARDLGASIGGGAGNDTRGTQRRPDMLAGSTSPVLPTMGAIGFGK